MPWKKLQLNDASLFFEPETSIALGLVSAADSWDFCIWKSSRSVWNVSTTWIWFTTAPGVVYHVHKKNGEMIELTNPSNLPDPTEIEYMEEPIVSAEIMVTTEFVGAIMTLCQERRGISWHGIY